MDNIFKAKSVLGYEVVCPSKTWEEHITSPEGHPIMAGYESNVASAIESPEKVYESSQTPKRHVYFAKDVYKCYGKEKKLYTKVVVGNKMNSWEVLSAWPQKSISGGIGGILYDKPQI